MTVATENSYAERQYTGVETTFTPGFSALAAADVHVGYLDDEGLPVELVQGTHFTVTLGGDRAVTVGRLAFPPASSLSPVTVWIERITPAVQTVNFRNLAAYDASVHEDLADAEAMRAAELRNRQMRTVTPFAVSGEAVDYRPRKVKAADPTRPEDLATKFYVDEHTGTAAAEEAKAARDEAVAAADTATGKAAEAVAAAAAAEGYAAILENPDYGFYVDAPTDNRDYGTYAP